MTEANMHWKFPEGYGYELTKQEEISRPGKTKEL